MKVVQKLMLFIWLVLFIALGVLATPAILPQWEMADSAMAYAYGHKQLGLWSVEHAQDVIAQANRTIQFLRVGGGLVGLSFGVFTFLLLRETLGKAACLQDGLKKEKQ